jgi:hypothetical protein
MAEEKTFTLSQLKEIIRDRMYTMASGRQPREGCNAKFYDLMYFLEHGHDDPDGSFADIVPFKQ